MLSQTGEHGLGGGGGGGKGTPQQLRTYHHHHPSVLTMYRGILEKEGIVGLWAGNGANLLRVFPAKAVVFSTNDMYKSILCRLAGVDKAKGPLAFLAGGLAGMTATALTYPLDFARGRISGKLAGVSNTNTNLQSTTSSSGQGKVRPTKEYSGITRTIVLTIKDEGVLALFKGITPTLLGAMPYEGIKFGTVGLLEQLFPTQKDHPASYYVTRKMLMGGMGGVMAGLLTYPNDTVRRMLQLQGSRGTSSEFAGYWDCVRKTYHEHGITRFYRGITINTLRMLPNVAIQFGSYELLKRWTADWF